MAVLEHEIGHPHPSWKEVTKWLLAGVLFLSGTLIQWHLADFHGVKAGQIEDRRAIIEGQKAIIQVVEQLKYLTSNSAEAQAWRAEMDRKIQALIEAETDPARQPVPGFGR